MNASERLARAVLMFYSGIDWNEPARMLWTTITGHREATTRVLGDLARQVLKELDSAKSE